MALVNQQAEQEVKSWTASFAEAFLALAIGGAGAGAILRLISGGTVFQGDQAGDLTAQLASFQQSFIAGKVAGIIGTNPTRRMSLSQLRDAVSNTQVAVLTDAESTMLAAAEQQTAGAIERLGGRLQVATDSRIATANADWISFLNSGEAGSASARGAARSNHLRTLSDQLFGELLSTDKRSRQLVQTQLASHFQEGQMTQAKPDELVYKIPRATAERQCLRLHIFSDGRPRLVKLSRARANGTNTGPPPTWKFVIGPVHINCYCILYRQKIDPRGGPNKRLADSFEIEGAAGARGPVTSTGRLLPSGPGAQRPLRPGGRGTPAAEAVVRFGDDVAAVPSRAAFAAQERAAAQVGLTRPGTRAGARGAPTRAAADIPELRGINPPRVAAPRTGTTVSSSQRKVSDTIEKRRASKPKATQTTSDLDQIYLDAAEADPILQNVVRELADTLDGNAVFQPGLKGRKRAIQKRDAKYGGRSEALTDISRATLEFDNIDDVYKALKVLDDRGMIVRLNDRFARPTAEGYRDIITNVVLPNGHVAELQLHVKNILVAKERNHILYERQRAITAKAKLAKRSMTLAEEAEVAELIATQRRAYEAAL